MRRDTPPGTEARAAGCPVARIAMALAWLQVQTPWSNGNNNIVMYNGLQLAAGTTSSPEGEHLPGPLMRGERRGMICTEVQRERLPHRSRRPR